MPSSDDRGPELLAGREPRDPVGDRRDGRLGGGGDGRQGNRVVVELDLEPLGFQQPLEGLADIEPQSVGEEDAGPDGDITEPGRISPGEGLVPMALLE